MPLSQLQLRIISAICMLGVVALVMWLGQEVFRVFVTVLFGLMIAEWFRLLSKADKWPVSPKFFISIAISVAGFVVSQSVSLHMMLAINVVTSLILLALNWGAIEKKWMAVWPFYLSVACGLTLWTYSLFGPLTLLWLLVLIWATDTGAYFTGRSIGGPKLMVTVSPNKTWSGAIGGVVAALVSSFAFISYASVPTMLLGEAMLIGVVTICLSVASQAGDLFESFAKRQHNVKDSSNLIPGHGGLLDRMDGLLIAVPVAFVFLYSFA
ncbi:MAG: phosphatidate cytidylyltransferase [Alphaproteobacteria bacterium]